MKLKRLSLYVGLFIVIAVALTVMYGWIQNISIYKTLLPGRPAMKANAAMLFLVIGFLMLLAFIDDRRKWQSILGAFLSVSTIIYAGLVLLEYGFHYDYGIDELFFIDPNGLNGPSPPGRFSPMAAVNFILISLGLLFDLAPRRPMVRLSQTFLMLCFINSVQSFLGSAFHISRIFGMDLFIPMPLHTAFSFTLLSVIFLAFRSNQGLMERFTADSASSLMSRRMLIAALLIDPLLKGISIYFVDVEFLTEGVGVFLQSIGGGIFISLLIVITAGALLRNEREQEIGRQLIEENRRELEKAKNEAEAASSAKSQFLANMSHEIRTPLGIILGFSELGLESLDKPEEAANYLRSINRNAHELSKLLGEILDLSKVEANKLDAEKISFNWINLVEDVCNLLRIKAEEKGIQLILTLEQPLPGLIESDPTRLRQILINLIGNAIKFTQAGTVRVNVSAHLDKAIQLYAIRFEVKDSGIGISDEQKKFLFKPFAQADSSMTRKFGGTGLGLVLSKQLAMVLGGDLELLHSEPQQGSTFVCTLFSKAQVQPAKTANQPILKNIDLSELQILLAEDSLDNQVLINHYLRATGAKIQIANNGQEAVEMSAKREFDLVLMDIQMPVMDGFRALAELRAQGFKKPIIAITAHAMKEEQERAYKAGFNNYLT